MTPDRPRDQPTSGREPADVTLVEVTLIEDPARPALVAHRIAVLWRVVVALAVSTLLAAAAVAALEGRSTGRGSHAAREVRQQEPPALDPILSAVRVAAACFRSRLAAPRAAGGPVADELATFRGCRPAGYANGRWR
jgi:hypothetical protein